MRLWLAFRIFFAVLFNAKLATAAEDLLREGEVEHAKAVPPSSAEPPLPKVAPVAKRSDAITLLAALQREARLIDIVTEPLGEYSDQQIGAAARDVLRDCATVLERMFAIESIVEDNEGAEIETSDTFDAGQYRLIGNVTGDPPYKGRLVHHGWRATQCELPQWSGSEPSSMVIAPVELEVS